MVAGMLRSLLETVIPTIRFPIMTKSELFTKVFPTGILTEKEMKEVKIYKSFQRYGHLFNNIPPQVSFPTERRVFVRQFTWDSDFDENGVIFWLGTDGGQTPFQNPLYNRTGVRVQTSRYARGESSCITGRQASRFWTSGSTMTEPSFVSIDLGEKHQLIPSCYTIMHGYRDGKDCVRSWTFEGSHDHHEWHILSVHTNDDSLSSGYAKKTFQVIPPTEMDLHNLLRDTQTLYFDSQSSRTNPGYVIPGYGEWFDETKVQRDENNEPIRDEAAERREREQVFTRLAHNAFSEKRKKFRYFRIRMTGPNSGGCGQKWYGWLTLCQIELYGTLYSFE